MPNERTRPVPGHPGLTVTRENYNTAIVQVEFDTECMDVVELHRVPGTSTWEIGRPVAYNPVERSPALDAALCSAASVWGPGPDAPDDGRRYPTFEIV